MSKAKMKVFGELKRKRLVGPVPEVLAQAIETLRAQNATRLANKLEVWALEYFNDGSAPGQP